MRKDIHVYYGEGIQKVELSQRDEVVLRGMLAEQHRWTRITPAGKRSVEPLITDFQRIDGRFCVVNPGPYVGIVALNDVQLIFNSPKWLKGLDNNHLYYMLIRSNPLSPKTVDLPEMPSEQTVSADGLLEPLFNLFVSEAYSALKKGVYKTYVKEENVSPNLKGKLDFRRQIKLEISSKPYFATQRQVFTERNPLNELLFWACKVIESHSNNNRTQALVEQLLKMLPVFKKPNLGNMLVVQPERRGFHLRWAVQLAKLVVNKESISFQGHQEQLFSMVINLFDLFESYVASELMLRDAKFKHQFELPFVDNTVIANNGWDKRRVFPDLVYNDGDKFVLDVKMKRIRSSGTEIEDIYQLHFYASLLGVSKAVLVHPTNQPIAEIKKFPVSYNPENVIEIICYGLPIVGSREEMTRSIEELYQFLMTSV